MEEVPNAKRQKVAMPASELIDESDLQRLGRDMAQFDEKRETVIKQSRDIGKLAKNAIFSLHRSDLGEAAAKLSRAENLAAILQAIVSNEPDLRHGSFSVAMEEYAEAKIFENFLKMGKLMPSSALPQCNRDEYLGGCLDFTGELNRYAVAKATQRNIEVVQNCKELVESIFGQFLQYDLRNGAIRKKFDTVKYTLKKLETLLYELSLARVSMRIAEDAEPPPEDTGSKEPTLAHGVSAPHLFR